MSKYGRPSENIAATIFQTASIKIGAQFDAGRTMPASKLIWDFGKRIPFCLKRH